MVDERIAALAASQHGVMTRQQLLAAGLTPRMVQARLRSRRLRALHRGIYLLGGLRGSLEPARAPEMAAVLACGPRAAVSHRSAAWLWELLPPPAGKGERAVEVTVPEDARRQRPRIFIRRSDDLAPDQTTLLDGIPVTTAARTLRDLSMVVTPLELNRAAARAERRGLVHVEELRRLVAGHGGRHGAPLLRAAMSLDGGPAFTRSEAEERFMALIRSVELPTPKVNVFLHGYEADFYWEDERIVVEVDGFEFHGDRQRFEDDHGRDADLAAHGVQVIRVTWRQLVNEPRKVLVRLAGALARAAPRS